MRLSIYIPKTEDLIKNTSTDNSSKAGKKEKIAHFFKKKKQELKEKKLS